MEVPNSGTVEAPSGGNASTEPVTAPEPSPSPAPAVEQSTDTDPFDAAIARGFQRASGEDPAQAAKPVDAKPPAEAEPPAAAPTATPPAPKDDLPFKFADFAQALEKAPELRPLLGRLHQFEESFGTVANAKAISEIVRTPEDAQFLRDSTETLDALNEYLDSDDPAAHRAVLESVKTENPERYQHLRAAVQQEIFAAPDFVESLPREIKKAVYEGTLERHMATAQADGNADFAYAIGELLKDARGRGGQAAQASAPVDPVLEKAQKRIAELEGRDSTTRRARAEAFQRTSSERVRAGLEKSVMEKIGTPAGMTAWARQQLFKEAVNEVHAAVFKDPIFRSQLNQLPPTHDEAHLSAATELFNRYSGRVVPRTVAKLMSEATAGEVSIANGRIADHEAIASRREPGSGVAPPTAGGNIRTGSIDDRLDSIIGKYVPGFASAG